MRHHLRRQDPMCCISPFSELQTNTIELRSAEYLLLQILLNLEEGNSIKGFFLERCRIIGKDSNGLSSYGDPFPELDSGATTQSYGLFLESPCAQATLKYPYHTGLTLPNSNFGSLRGDLWKLKKGNLPDWSFEQKLASSKGIITLRVNLKTLA